MRQKVKLHHQKPQFNYNRCFAARRVEEQLVPSLVRTATSTLVAGSHIQPQLLPVRRHQANTVAYIRKTSSVAEMVSGQKKIGLKFGLKMA